jgi:hypothetical protein
MLLLLLLLLLLCCQLQPVLQTAPAHPLTLLR